jgi:hypothetical protein
MSVFRTSRTRFCGVVVVCASLCVSQTVKAQGRAQGAIVVKNDAPFYRSDTGDGRELGIERVARGFPLAGITVIMGEVRSFMAEVQNNRAHVLYLGHGITNTSGLHHRAWMNTDDLSFFTFDCGCGEKDKSCSPLTTAGWISERWNPCFQEAYDKKLRELKPQWEKEDAERTAAIASGSVVDTRTWAPGTYLQQKDRRKTLELKSDGSLMIQQNGKTATGTYTLEGDIITTILGKSTFALRRTGNALVGEKNGTVWEKAATQSSGASQVSSPSTPAAAPVSTEQVLTNADVLSLVKVGLGEELIAAKIKQVKAVAFDLSTDGLVALRNGGVPNTVIEAMMRRAAN